MWQICDCFTRSQISDPFVTDVTFGRKCFTISRSITDNDTRSQTFYTLWLVSSHYAVVSFPKLGHRESFPPSFPPKLISLSHFPLLTCDCWRPSRTTHDYPRHRRLPLRPVSSIPDHSFFHPPFSSIFYSLCLAPAAGTTGHHYCCCRNQVLDVAIVARNDQCRRFPSD